MSSMPRPPVRLRSYILVFLFLAAILILAHGPLLHLPYYWDEIGQFVPAALDIFENGHWIPQSTLPNVHPPAVMAYLAAVWSVAGYSVEGTRVAMLLVAALGALGAFLLSIELGRGAPGVPGFITVLLLAASPLFFSQSMMALLDMPAMTLTVFALVLFLQDRTRACALLCCVLVLVKETGVVAPLVFAAWLLRERRFPQALWFFLPLFMLGLWLLALNQATGHWFGNAGFTQFNLWYPLHPVRLAFALIRRGYYLFLSTGHFIGTAAFLYAWRRMPQVHSRPWKIVYSFAAAHVLAVCLLGGAVLERYLLPVLPLLYAAFASAFVALPARWAMGAFSALIVCLAAANLVNPPYPFPLENNLAWTAFVSLEQDAARAIDSSPPGPVATVFPFSDALRRKEFGFINHPRAIEQIASFRPSDLRSLPRRTANVMVVFTETWDPLRILQRPPAANFLRRYYGYEPEASVPQIAQMFGLARQQTWRRNGLEFDLLSR